MTSISAPAVRRNWQRMPNINAASNDYVNDQSVRVSFPCYVDLTTSQRKDILNAIREISNQRSVATPNTASGLTVETAVSAGPDVESYIGMTLDVLRGMIFQRGGLEVSLVLRLQEVTGLEFVSVKDFAAAMKGRQDLIKNYTKEHPFNP